MIYCMLQARMGSTRLPGKVLKPLGGMPMLAFQIKRLQLSKVIDRIVIATSAENDNDTIAKLAQDLGLECYQGSEDDVLDRFYQTGLSCGFGQDDLVVRVTGDCPLIDPSVVDAVVREYKEKNNDYMCNNNPPTYPDGMDVEVFTFAALQRSWQEAKLPSEREHVTPYLYKHPDLFSIGTYRNPAGDCSSLRLTVDELADYQLVQIVVDHFYPRTDFTLDDMLAFLKQNPKLVEINSRCTRNEGYTRSLLKDQADV